MYDLGADGEYAGDDDEGKVDQTATGGFEDPVEGDLGLGRSGSGDLVWDVCGRRLFPCPRRKLETAGGMKRVKGACEMLQRGGTHSQEEEGDKVKAFVALAILGDLIGSEPEVGRDET